MLKFFFWCLLLVNGVLFAYQRGYLNTLVSDGREPGRMTSQLNADKIKLITAGAIDAAPAAPPAAVPVDKKTVVVACAEIGNFNAADAKRFETQLAALSLGDGISQRKQQEVASHMVFIPPLGSKENADKKAGELRRLGISDFFVVQDNSNLRWGISLGIFRTEEAAQSHLTNLNQKGVHSARLTVRNNAVSSTVAFLLRDLDANAKAGLDKIKAGFPNQEVRSCE